ncbi:25863_t:CDS:2 [Dentiscutata erythropus]|uniref:25863_t:CDS:1 n=1 Tax=Dentiscutata erythropus TaxID=1348616 RepID=A0A9N9BWN6_9GLOM|nr:25863_t:CDS:2 [Dentiscutata erythropus]
MNDKGKRKATSELEIQIRNQKKSRNMACPPSSWLKNWEWLEYLETDGTLRMFCKLYIVKRHDEKDQKHQRAKQQLSA